VELKQIEDLIYKGKTEKAKNQIKKLEGNLELALNEQINLELLKSLIFLQEGKYKRGLKVVHQIFNKKDESSVESQIFIDRTMQITNPLLFVDRKIIEADALCELGKLEKSVDEINKAETILTTHVSEDHAEYVTRLSRIKYLLGKIHQKQGDFEQAIDYFRKTLTINQKTGNSYDTANSFLSIGKIHLYKGDNDSAILNFEKSLNIFKILNHRLQTAKILGNLGKAYELKKQLDLSLKYNMKGLSIAKEVGNEYVIAIFSLNIGLLHFNRGELSSAIKFYEQALIIFKNLNVKNPIGRCQNHLGRVYLTKGELDLAEQFFKQSLANAREVKDYELIAFSFMNLALVFQIKGEIESAIANFKSALNIFEEIGNSQFLALSLHNLIQILTSIGSNNEADFFFKKLEEIFNKDQSKFITQLYSLTKAMILKTSDRIIKKAEAQQLFQQIVQEEVINIELTLLSMLYLSDLLLIELKTTGSAEVLSDVKMLINQLFQIASTNNSYLWLAQAYWLQSKLALIELNVETAQSLLKQAESLANGKGYIKLANEISKEYSSLVRQLSKWQKFTEETPTIIEIVELTQIEDLIQRMVSKRIYRKEEDVIDYAVKARTVVEKWQDPE
jgi:tetratricopeptide (TPR) repeat protein